MASSGKKKTTMAKLTRESRLRQRRMDKQARKDARKNEPPGDPYAIGEMLDPATGEPYVTAAELPDSEQAAEQPAIEPAVKALADA